MGASGAGSAEKIYVEDVFSTWLYTGNGSTQTITNGIDLSGKGGMVWIKGRTGSAGSIYHALYDTNRGASNGYIRTNATNAASGNNLESFAFASTGFSFNANAFYLNDSSIPSTYTSWTFRKAAKFFDVVTYTGNGSNRTIAHNLGSVPGTIIVKRTDTAADWQVYHRSFSITDYLVLNSTALLATAATRWNDTTPTSTVFSLGTDATVNASGGTYVAYLFAHNAGGFGDAGTDSVVSCGNYTGNGSTTGPTVTLGWEPQWLLIKNAGSTGDWNLIDNMRGFTVGGADAELNPNLSAAESSGTFVTPLSNGFQLNTTDAGYNASGDYYIYIAIRRGPMKTPTDATKVFNAVTYTGTGTNSRIYTGAGFPLDAVLINDRLRTSGDSAFVDRLRGAAYLATPGTSAETTGGSYYASKLDSMDGYTGGTLDFNQVNLSGLTLVDYYFRRAPRFFDVVAYTGNGSTQTINHNLGVAPEMIIAKCRSGGTESWEVTAAGMPFGIGMATAQLNSTAAATDTGRWGSFTPTSTQFRVDWLAAGNLNGSGRTYIAYLFASCPGVSKVGSYTGTGTGTTLNINCGFTNGARFVLIKRTDSTGDWYVWDTARGIIAANDPYLLLNSTAAEVTNTDFIDPLSSGFQISSTAPAAINANGGSFIYLAIA